MVHLGPGAFFRAHQADRYNRLLAMGDARWEACGVSLRSAAAAEALAPQDGLYTLAELGGAGSLRVIGALSQVLSAPFGADAVLARLASPATRVIALTVTEKGYHLDGSGELDGDDAAVERDRLALDAPETAPGWVLAGLRARRARGLAPPLVLSCDNLPANGSKLKGAVVALARLRGEAGLADWIEAEAACPDSMVDSITPAADAALQSRVESALGVHDAAPVQRERFSQWVVGDVGHPALDDLAKTGVTLTRDVAGWEQAKLRLLNGAHSTLAYLGGLAGLETVADAMADPRLRRFVGRLMREAVLPTVRAPRGMDPYGYVEAVLDRFDDRSVVHRLAQIAADGSRKLPIRLGASAAEAIAVGAPPGPFAVPYAAWMLHVVRNAGALEDPARETLRSLAARCGGEAEADTALFLDATSAAPAFLRQNASFRRATARAYATLAGADPLGALESAWTS